MISPLSFNISSPIPTPKLGARLGRIALNRSGASSSTINIDTPGLLTTTSRGVVPHLSRDHVDQSNAIRWVHIPFETFLESKPPVPTLQPGETPLHTFLGYRPSQHILSMSLRDPYIGRDMPPNGNAHVNALSVRGVSKVTTPEWHSYVSVTRPDIVVALSDTPFTALPHSQKRITKSIERSAAWLANILQPGLAHPLNVLVNMAGGISIAARTAFADSLSETLHGKEAEAIRPFKCLDEGVFGYNFDLVPLRTSLLAQGGNDDTEPTTSPALPNKTSAENLTSRVLPLLKASLNHLSPAKLRLVNSVDSPHEILRLIEEIGIDVFDSHWAQSAADIGIALDFRFPVTNEAQLTVQPNGKCKLGHNLYDPIYAHNFSRLADNLLDGMSATNVDAALVCPCVACSPVSPSVHIEHSSLDSKIKPAVRLPPYTRAYIHHLLHTHEMSSHSLLAMHNLAVLDAFFAGVRAVLGEKEGLSRFSEEVKRFMDVYDEDSTLFDEARIYWNEVEMARGKGRLAREKAKQEGSALGSTVEL